MAINISIKRKDFYLLTAVFVFLLGAGFVMAVWNPAANPQSHDSDNIKVTVSGTDYSLQEAIDSGLLGAGGGVSSYYVPSEIKATNIGHDGNFGGYNAIYNWIQANDCAGYHVCDVSEIARYAQTGAAIPAGWYIVATQVGGTSNPDCGGWTTTSGKGLYWTGSKPNEKDCTDIYPVLCCK